MTSPAEYETRVRALESMNNLLAEQIDRMQIVMKMAQVWYDNDKGFTRIALRNAVSTYNATMKWLAREGR